MKLSVGGTLLLTLLLYKLLQGQSLNNDVNHSWKTVKHNIISEINPNHFKNVDECAIYSAASSTNSKCCEYLNTVESTQLENLNSLVSASYLASNCHSINLFAEAFESFTEMMKASNFNPEDYFELAFSFNCNKKKLSDFSIDWVNLYEKLEQYKISKVANISTLEDKLMMSYIFATLATIRNMIPNDSYDHRIHCDIKYMQSELRKLPDDSLALKEVITASNYYYSLMVLSKCGLTQTDNIWISQNTESLILKSLAESKVDTYSNFIPFFYAFVKKSSSGLADSSTIPEKYNGMIESVQIISSNPFLPSQEMKLYDSKTSHSMKSSFLSANKLKISIQLKSNFKLTDKIASSMAILIEESSSHFPSFELQPNWAIHFPNQIQNSELTYYISFHPDSQLIPSQGLYLISFLNLNNLGGIKHSDLLYSTWIEFSDKDNAVVCKELKHEYTSKPCIYPQFYPLKEYNYKFSQNFPVHYPILTSSFLFLCTLTSFTVLFIIWVFIIKVNLDLFGFSPLQITFSGLIALQTILLLLYFGHIPLIKTMKILIPTFCISLILGNRGLSDITNKRFVKSMKCTKED